VVASKIDFISALSDFGDRKTRKIGQMTKI